VQKGCALGLSDINPSHGNALKKIHIKQAVKEVLALVQFWIHLP
jgi:hypothetical protein